MQVLRCPETLVKGNRVFHQTNKIPVRSRSTSTASSVGGTSDDVSLSKEYQFLPKNALPTYYFQKSLPRLPIPKLELTVQRYLDAVQPILTNEQFSKTKIFAENFGATVGQELHASLVQMDKQLPHTSYISGPWFEMYLRDRLPLPINTNPALVFVEDESLKSIPSDQRQLVRATNLLVSSLRFLKSLDNETLGPEVFHMNPVKSDTSTWRTTMKLLPTAFATYGSYIFKAFPLDMSQYTSLFRSTRIPQKDIDRLLKSDKSVRHIAVVRRGQFYSCPVLDENGNILPISVLKGSLEAILNDNNPVVSHPVGVMTSQERNKWAEIREHMSQNPINRQSLAEIDTALFVLGLDDDDDLGEDPEKVTRLFLHSNGTNRWFDKSFSLILSKDGWAGVNFEHAWGDGVAVMRFFNEIHNDSTKNKWSNSVNSKKPSVPPAKLPFELDAKSKAGIEEAQKRLLSQSERLQIHPYISENYGRKRCKKWGISPDALMQLGFQIAYNRLHKHTTATYESCSTSAFRHGRTEAIRPATTLTKEVSEILCTSDWKSRKGDLKELIKKCSVKHAQLTKDAAMGQGFDRHLYAMKVIAQSRGSDLHDIYQDEAYRIINHNILSTSTLASPAVRIGAFGPVVSNGYGLAYQIWDTGLGCLATTYKGEKDGLAFTNSCKEVFADLEDILQ